MTAFDPLAVLRAVRGVAAGELGSRRLAVDSAGNALAVYSPGLLEALGDNPIEAMAFFRAGSWFDLTIGPLRDHASTPVSGNSNVVHKLLDIVVEGLSSGGKGFDRVLELQAAALSAGFGIANALGCPGNLTVDDRGKQTAIVSGCLIGPGGAPGNPVATTGERDCHLIRWRVSAAAILDLEV